MSQTSTAERPRQVTMGGGLAIGGSVFLMLSIFETLGRVGSVDLRESVEETLAGNGAGGLGVTVDQAMTLIRGGLSVAAVCTAVTFVCGVFVLLRHSGARIALTVATVPIFLTSLFTGTLVAIFLVAATFLLWSGPARDWFAGRPVRELPTGRSERRDRDADQQAAAPAEREVPARPATPRLEAGSGSSAPPAASGISTLPRPTQGYGDRPGGQSSTQPGQQAYAAGGHGYPDPTAPGGPWSSTPGADARAPRAVRVAVMLTWIGVALLLAVRLPVLVATFYSQLDELREQVASMMAMPAGEPTRGMLQTSVWLLVGILVVWGVSAAVLALLTLRRHGWARIMLLVSAGVTVPAALLDVPFGWPLAIMAGVAFVLLLRTDSREWFSGRSGPAGPSGPPPRSYQPPQQPAPRRAPW